MGKDYLTIFGDQDDYLIRTMGLADDVDDEEICPHCGGSGEIDGFVCSFCDGTGQIDYD